MSNFVSGLEPTFKVLTEKCPSLQKADVVLAGTELLAREILIPGRSTRLQFAQWLTSITEEEVKSIIEKRKSFKIEADSDKEAMLKAREEEEERQRVEMEEMQAQMEKARSERSMVFNPATGSFEEVKKEESK